jgi:hypothetical protein
MQRQYNGAMLMSLKSAIFKNYMDIVFMIKTWKCLIYFFMQDRQTFSAMLNYFIMKTWKYTFTILFAISAVFGAVMPQAEISNTRSKNQKQQSLWLSTPSVSNCLIGNNSGKRRAHNPLGYEGMSFAHAPSSTWPNFYDQPRRTKLAAIDLSRCTIPLYICYRTLLL